jgi:fructuronate reductase
MAMDDDGNPFTLSPDPMLEMVCPYVRKIEFGMTDEVEEMIQPVLRNKSIFGVDLYEAGIAQSVCSYFIELIAGAGAVRATLRKEVY